MSRGCPDNEFDRELNRSAALTIGVAEYFEQQSGCFGFHLVVTDRDGGQWGIDEIGSGNVAPCSTS